MIRIKCPKCSILLTLDDSEAGQVGECTECGARFRVPARKPVPGRPTKEDAAQRSPAKRGRDDEDDDDEDEDDEEDEPGPAAKRPKSKEMSESARQTKVLCSVFLVAIIAFGIGGIYIKLLAILVGGVSVFLMLACGLMVAREALADSTARFLMVWLIAPYFFFYAIENWKRTKQLVIPYAGFLLLALVSLGSWYLHEDRVVDQRKRNRFLMDNPPQAVQPR